MCKTNNASVAIPMCTWVLLRKRSADRQIECVASWAISGIRRSDNLPLPIKSLSAVRAYINTIAQSDNVPNASPTSLRNVSGFSLAQCYRTYAIRLAVACRPYQAIADPAKCNHNAPVRTDRRTARPSVTHSTIWSRCCSPIQSPCPSNGSSSTSKRKSIGDCTCDVEPGEAKRNTGSIAVIGRQNYRYPTLLSSLIIMESLIIGVWTESGNRVTAILRNLTGYSPAGNRWCVFRDVQKRAASGST